LKNKTPPLKVLGKGILALLGLLLTVMLILIGLPKIFGEGIWQGGVIYVILFVITVLIGLYIKKLTGVKTDWDWKTGKEIIISEKTKDKKGVKRTNS